MSKKSFLLIVFLMLAIPFQLLYLYGKNENSGTVAGAQANQPKAIINSLFIGEFRFTLFGYTSPYAEVSLIGQGISDQTTANSTGYFEFENRFSPFSSHEACLSSKDQFGRISTPTCLPPFPTLTNVNIGPVIIPPTISLDKPGYYVGDEVVLTGQTIPEEDINLAVFTEPQNPFLAGLNPIKSVEAYSLPRLNSKSDDKGNFSISLPSSQAQNYRLFTQVNFEDSLSPNSLALKVKILPIWMIIFRFFGFIWNILRSRLLETIIILEIIGLTAHFLRLLLHPYYLVSKKNAIVIYESHLPEIEEKHPLMKRK